MKLEDHHIDALEVLIMFQQSNYPDINPAQLSAYISERFPEQLALLEKKGYVTNAEAPMRSITSKGGDLSAWIRMWGSKYTLKQSLNAFVLLGEAEKKDYEAQKRENTQYLKDRQYRTQRRNYPRPGKPPERNPFTSRIRLLQTLERGHLTDLYTKGHIAYTNHESNSYYFLPLGWKLWYELDFLTRPGRGKRRDEKEILKEHRRTRVLKKNA